MAFCIRPKFTALWKAALLVGVVPVLIGHALDAPDSRYEPDPAVYTLSGGSDPGGAIHTDNPLYVFADGKMLLKADEAATGEVPAITFTRTSERENPLHLEIRTGSLLVDGTLGPLWLHPGDGRRIKLMDAAATGPTGQHSFIAHYRIDVVNAKSTPEVAPAATGSVYILSGGSEPSTPIDWSGSLHISLNSSELVAADPAAAADTQVSNPVSFAAVPGDLLSVNAVSYDAGNNAHLGDVSPLWLHLPSGEVRALVHRTGYLSYLPGDQEFLGAHFILE